jgi:rhamnosyltransferase
MTESITAVIPVRDGARFLAELLDALAREGPDEILVVDSGSSDGSQDIARGAGAELIEIAPHAFGHGRTRNFAAERASGDVIAFLTQDATPAPGWLAAIRDALALSEDVGAVFGPHLPRPETSPMIARELTEFFATFGGGPRIFGEGDASFLSNVNAAYRRACWAEIRFDDVRYSEDQAFGRQLAAHPKWRKAYHPRAAVLHAHDYSPVAFMRRYFDEYRGLRATIDHVEPLAPRSSLRGIRDQVRADRAYLGARGVDGAERLRWTARSALHHSSRKAFAVLGSRAETLPGPVQRVLSLEGGENAGPTHPRLPIPCTRFSR